jgi:NADPH:quinone reductase-like Zn-dependent oxidoreductase
MRAVVYRKYGLPDVLELQEIDKPVVPDDGVLVRVHAASVNPLDWHFLTGTPYLMRLMTGLRKPERQVLGVDFAGTVESVGGRVTQFQPGDEVFGGGRGALAEYVCVTEDRAVQKPANLTFEQAAAAPVAGLTALQGLRDKGQIQPGQQVLINGASGGVGTFAVQIAKSFGAEVTGVCSTSNVHLVRSIGADRAIDYTQEDFTRNERRYDLMLDIAGNRAWSECKRVLDPKGRFVLVGGPKTNRWVGPLGHFVKLRWASMGGSRKVAVFIATMNKQDLGVLQALLEAGKVTPVIDRRHGWSEVREAFRYLGEGHAKGKIVITV